MRNSILALILASVVAPIGFAQEIELGDLNVTANIKSENYLPKQGKYLGLTTINKELFESMPSSNRGMTSILRTNPNVQFENSQITSKNSGEIDPEDISINGAKFYQNNFMIDGLNINNDLNPAVRVSEQNNPAGKVFPDLGSISQGINLDTDLIDTLNVYDSSISARYGGFQGGVIDARTRDPRQGFHGKISASHSEDSWTKFYIDENEEKAFKESYESDKQPTFSKWKQGVTLEGYLTENFGLLFDYSVIQSKIPLVGYDPRFMSDDASTYEQERVMTRKNENFLLKGKWFVDDRLTITPMVVYAPNSGVYYDSATKDSKQTMRSGGLISSVDVDYEFDWANFKQIFGYTQLESSRRAENDYWIQWHPSKKRPWGAKDFNSYEGGFGDIDQKQKTFSYNASLDFEPIWLYDVEHNFVIGAEVKHSKGSHAIPNNFFTATRVRFLRPGESCAPNDPWCSMDATEGFGGRNHYQSMLSKYKTGETSASVNQLSLWLEDEMKIGNLTLRPGVRFDSDDYMNKNTIAPRFASTYDLFGDGTTEFVFGLNRYYGRSPFAYALKEGRDKLQSRWVREKETYSPWIEDVAWNERNKKSEHMFRELKIPYDDELSLGINQELGNFDLSLKYIKRNSKDEVTASTAELEGITPDGNKYKTNTILYANHGKSKSDIYTFVLNNIHPYEFYGSRHSFALAFDYKDTATNFSTYDDRVDESMIENRIIKYDGKYIKYSEQPAKQFYKPWTLRLATVSQFPQINMNWSNFFKLEDGYTFVSKEGIEMYNGEEIDVYKTKKYKKTFTWDTRFGFSWELPKKSSAFVNIDILNVLNRKKVTAAANTYLATARVFTDIPTYEIGRQFWLEVGYKW